MALKCKKLKRIPHPKCHGVVQETAILCIFITVKVVPDKKNLRMIAQFAFENTNSSARIIIKPVNPAQGHTQPIPNLAMIVLEKAVILS